MEGGEERSPGAGGRERSPARIRYRIPLTVLPPLVGVVVAALLWGDPAQPAFFAAAVQVLAIGAIGLALTGRFFRVGIHRRDGIIGAYAIFNVLAVLVATGVGLFYSFRALANGAGGHEDFAMVAASLATGVSAFTIQAMFGTPGLRDEAPVGDNI